MPLVELRSLSSEWISYRPRISLSSQNFQEFLFQQWQRFFSLSSLSVIHLSLSLSYLYTRYTLIFTFYQSIADTISTKNQCEKFVLYGDSNSQTLNHVSPKRKHLAMAPVLQRSYSLSLTVSKSYKHTTSVTGWLDYFSTFGRLHLWKFAQCNTKFAKEGPKSFQIVNKPSKIGHFAKVANFAKSGLTVHIWCVLIWSPVTFQFSIWKSKNSNFVEIRFWLKLKNK